MSQPFPRLPIIPILPSQARVYEGAKDLFTALWTTQSDMDLTKRGLPLARVAIASALSEKGEALLSAEKRGGVRRRDRGLRFHVARQKVDAGQTTHARSRTRTRTRTLTEVTGYCRSREAIAKPLAPLQDLDSPVETILT